jgi:hypothetical protein
MMVDDKNKKINLSMKNKIHTYTDTKKNIHSKKIHTYVRRLKKEAKIM